MSLTRKPPFAVLVIVGLLLGVPGLTWSQWHFPVIGGPLPNDATSLGQDCFEITNANDTRGVVWDSTQIDLSQPFDITLSVNMAPWGADGIALVLQNAGLNAWGDGANALGFGSSLPTPNYPPIVNSVAFELDTWDNSGAGVFDIPPDHVAIHINGDMTTTQGLPVSANPAGFDVTDGLCHQLRVTWNPTINQIRIFFDGGAVPRITRTYNMVANVFGGNPMVWWGITGSSGGAGMTQRVCVGRNFASAGVDRSICAGDTARLRALGGTSYTWSPAGPPLSNSSISNPVFGPAAPGNYAYQVSVINSALCTDIDSVILQVESVPVANPGLPANVCLGDSFQLGTVPLPGNSYLWQPATDLSNPNIARPWLSPSATGALNYDLIVTNVAGIAGCADTASITITALDTPTVSITASSQNICAGQTISLAATASGGGGGHTFAWSNGPTASNQTVSPAATTNYAVTITDALSCQSSDNVTITLAPNPTANVGSVSAVCLGDSALLGTPGLPGHTYLWQPNAFLSNANTPQPWLTAASPGLLNYDLIVSLTTGLTTCTDTASLAVMVHDTPTVSIIAVDDSLCLGQSTNLTASVTGGAGPFGYSWLNGPMVASQVVSPTTNTPYFVRITDGNNCVTGGNILVVVTDPPTVSMTATPDSVCSGQASALVANASGGTPGYSYLWSNGGTSPGTTINPLATTTATLEVTDAAGCTGSASVVVTVNVTDSVAIMSSDTFLCLGGILQVNNTFGTPGVNSWQWTPTTGVSNPNIPNPTILPTTGTVYYLQGINSVTGCGYRDSIVIGYASLGPPSLNLGSDTAICQGSTITLDATNPGFLYLWSNNSTAPIWTDSAMGWISVTVYDTLGCGFTVQDSLYLTVHPTPLPLLPADATICPSDSIALSTSIAPANYLWSTGDTLPMIFAQIPGTYWVRVTDGNRCAGSDTFMLAVSSNLTVALGNLAPDYCISDPAAQLTFSPTGGVFSGSVSPTGLFTPANAGVGTFILQYSVADSTGCVYFDTEQTEVHAAPTVAQAGPDQVVTDAAQLAANAPLIGMGSWTIIGGTAQLSALGDPQAQLTGMVPGNFILVWTISQAPCPDSKDTLVITVEGLTMPTGFSPNNDGVNDMFVIQGITNISNAHLSVFNRWGNLVWQNSTYSNQWDGRNLDGQALVDDTYYAVLTYGSKSLTSYVVLKRE